MRNSNFRLDAVLYRSPREHTVKTPRIVSAGEQSEWEMWLTIKISFNISESRLWRQAARTDAEDGVTLRAMDVSLRPGDASSNDEPRKLQAGKMPAANLLFHSAF
ncbi:hypothetical protein DPX16_15223 [Anabarilius grahami]|uniref:Uncharacterized protein n=1 Tax=Anabarilius grahami TaxID=495550 RepID=A0A3N0XVZ5_ANAGA|nr:hypothetical protein DPX16_15223 [Anabarilius grahami]